MCHVPLGPPGTLLKRTNSTTKTMGCDAVNQPLKKNALANEQSPNPRGRENDEESTAFARWTPLVHLVYPSYLFQSSQHPWRKMRLSEAFPTIQSWEVTEILQPGDVADSKPVCLAPLPLCHLLTNGVQSLSAAGVHLKNQQQQLAKWSSTITLPTASVRVCSTEGRHPVLRGPGVWKHRFLLLPPGGLPLAGW